MPNIAAASGGTPPSSSAPISSSARSAVASDPVSHDYPQAGTREDGRRRRARRSAAQRTCFALAQLVEAHDREVAPAPGRVVVDGPDGAAGIVSGGLQVGLPVGEHVVGERQDAVAGLRQRGDLHQHDDLEVTVVDRAGG